MSVDNRFNRSKGIFIMIILKQTRSAFSHCLYAGHKRGKVHQINKSIPLCPTPVSGLLCIFPVREITFVDDYFNTRLVICQFFYVHLKALEARALFIHKGVCSFSFSFSFRWPRSTLKHLLLLLFLHLLILVSLQREKHSLYGWSHLSYKEMDALSSIQMGRLFIELIIMIRSAAAKFISWIFKAKFSSPYFKG